MNWDYVAGFFDGEGSLECRFILTGTRQQPRRVTRWKVTQMSREVLDEIQAFMLSEGIPARICSNGAYGGKDRGFTLETGKASDTYRVLLNIESKVIVKWEKVQEGMKFIEDLMRKAENGELVRRSKSVYLELANEWRSNGFS